MLFQFGIRLATLLLHARFIDFIMIAIITEIGIIKFQICSVHEMVLILANCKYFKIISGENRTCQPPIHSVFLLTLQYTNFKADTQILSTWECEV